MPRSRTALVLFALLTLISVYRALLSEPTVVDDVFIYLRYAEHIAQGRFAFQDGPPVEGTSSVLWSLLLGALIKMGFHGLGSAKILSLLLLPACLGLVATLGRAPGRAPLLAVSAIALDPDLTHWAASGMDTLLFATGLVLPVWFLSRGRVRTAAFFLGVLPWLRAEGLFLAPLGMALLLFYARQRRAFVPFLVPWLAITVVRLFYFGDPLPNTFYAKMADGARDYDGLHYALSALGTRPLLYGGAIAFTAWFAFRGREPRDERHALFLAALFFILMFGFAISSHGDWMPNRRFLVPALPLAAVLLSRALARLREIPRAAWFLFVAPALEAALVTDRALDQTWRHHEWLDRRVEHWTPRQGLFRSYALDWMPAYLLQAIAPYVAPGDRVAHVDMGQLPYVMRDVRFLDGFGLVDREAARYVYTGGEHERMAVLRAFEREPPVVAIVVFDEKTGAPMARGQVPFARAPFFREHYRELARIPTWGNHPCVVYVRSDRAPESRERTEVRIQRWRGNRRDLTGDIRETSTH